MYIYIYSQISVGQGSYPNTNCYATKPIGRALPTSLGLSVSTDEECKTLTRVRCIDPVHNTSDYNESAEQTSIGSLNSLRQLRPCASCLKNNRHDTNAGIDCRLTKAHYQPDHDESVACENNNIYTFKLIETIGCARDAIIESEKLREKLKRQRTDTYSSTKNNEKDNSTVKPYVYNTDKMADSVEKKLKIKDGDDDDSVMYTVKQFKQKEVSLPVFILNDDLEPINRCQLSEYIRWLDSSKCWLAELEGHGLIKRFFVKTLTMSNNIQNVTISDEDFNDYKKSCITEYHNAMSWLKERVSEIEELAYMPIINACERRSYKSVSNQNNKRTSEAVSSIPDAYIYNNTKTEIVRCDMQTQTSDSNKIDEKIEESSDNNNKEKNEKDNKIMECDTLNDNKLNNNFTFIKNFFNDVWDFEDISRYVIEGLDFKLIGNLTASDGIRSRQWLIREPGLLEKVCKTAEDWLYKDNNNNNNECINKRNNNNSGKQQTEYILNNKSLTRNVCNITETASPSVKEESINQHVASKSTEFDTGHSTVSTESISTTRSNICVESPTIKNEPLLDFGTKHSEQLLSSKNKRTRTSLRQERDLKKRHSGELKNIINSKHIIPVSDTPEADHTSDVDIRESPSELTT